MPGICTAINQGLFKLDTIISGTHVGECGKCCEDGKNKKGDIVYQSHPMLTFRPLTQKGIAGRAWDAFQVVIYNPFAFIGNTLRLLPSLATAFLTSYKLVTHRQKESVQAWKECGLNLKYMAQNVYYFVKYALLGLTPLTLCVKLYQYCNGIKVK